jgi:hypothetical protein
MALRIYVENPVDSGNWSKVRHWKHDGSLQSTLVQGFFERRRIEGLITRLEIRDGSDRHNEDALSLMTVGSRILHRKDKSDDGKSNVSFPRTGWFGLSRNNSTRSRGTKTLATNTDGEDEEQAAADEVPPPPPAKVRRARFASSLFKVKIFGSRDELANR